MLTNMRPIILLFFFGLSAIVSGCATQASTPYSSTSLPSTLSIAKQQQLINSIQQQHVQVVQRGDRLRMILPADIFFQPNSSTLSTNNLSTLTDIAELLRSYGHIPIQISGHSDHVNSEGVSSQLTTAQAQNIAAYFWSRGIALADMKVSGDGNQHTIASDTTVDGSAMNRRVEINIH